MTDTNETADTTPSTEPVNTLASGTQETTYSEPSTGGSTSSSSGNFLDDIPEDLRNEPCLSNIKDKASLVKSYVSSQRMLGNSIRIPGPDASPEVRNEFFKKLQSVNGVVALPDEKDEKAMGELYSKLGRPQTPDGYKVDLPEPIKNNEAAQEEIKNFRQFAHKLGLTSKQASALVGYQVTKAENEVNHKVQEIKQAEQTLKNHWGNEFENKIGVSKDLLKHYEAKYPDAVNSLRYGEAGRNPVFIMMAAELGRLYKETGAIQGGTALSTGLTPEEARDRITEVLNNKSHPYHDPNSPGHLEAVEKVQKYYKAIYGDGPSG